MSWIHNHSDLPDFLFPFLLFPYYPEHHIGKLFHGRLNLPSSESPENEGGRGWCCMCSYILVLPWRTLTFSKIRHSEHPKTCKIRYSEFFSSKLEAKVFIRRRRIKSSIFIRWQRIKNAIWKNIGVKIFLDKENDETHYLHFVASFL